MTIAAGAHGAALADGAPDVLTQLRAAAQAADAKGGIAPVALRVGEVFALADVFLIVGGEVERGVQAISDEIEDQLNSLGVRTIRREGRESGRWILLDFGDLIVHVFHQEDRGFYELERLWKDCPSIDLTEMLDAPGRAADLSE